jgi:MFS family permease
MSERLGGSRELLRHREFRLLFIGQGVSVLGNRMVDVALAFAVLEIGGSASDVGLVLAAGVVPAVLTVLAGGVVGDRTSRRLVMLTADVVRTVSQALMAALLITGTAEIWMLAVLAGVSGTGTGFFSPALTGVLPEIVAPDELQPANALRSTVISGSEILGPAIAGVIVAAVGAGWAIAVDAATFAVSVVCIWSLRLPERVMPEPQSFLTDLRDGWATFRSMRWVWSFVLYFAIANVFWGAWTALGPVAADRDLGGAAVWGTVLAAMGVGALVGSVYATRVRPARPLLVVAVCEGLFGLPVLFLAAAVPVPVLAASAFVSGVGLMVGMSVWESTLQRYVPPESLSRVASYDWFGSYAFLPLGLALWGSLAGAIGLYTTLWIAAGAFGLSAAILMTLPEVWRFRASRAEAPVP